MGASASCVADNDAWLTDTRQPGALPHTMWPLPNGPLITVKEVVIRPAVSAVTFLMPARLQSPGPVALPLLAHSVTTRASPGENPVATTLTVAGEFSPADGVTVRSWAPDVADVADVEVVVAELATR